jgi:hypothetical protein
VAQSSAHAHGWSPVLVQMPPPGRNDCDLGDRRGIIGEAYERRPPGWVLANSVLRLRTCARPCRRVAASRRLTARPRKLLYYNSLAFSHGDLSLIVLTLRPRPPRTWSRPHAWPPRSAACS